MLLAQVSKVIIKLRVDDSITKNRMILILRNEKSVMTVIPTTVAYNDFWMTYSWTLYYENVMNSVDANIIPPIAVGWRERDKPTMLLNLGWS